ncbi:DUF2190 domain-containing protein [Candidatus Aalborgicola defluviihabitans]|uniref:DUF2190 domain-containing protein n=1 Tax=Candidatus Aalborgicola defluviihabitans TaxID=3386187 RepID=UPI001D81F69D|nr:DUF2190 family protein [Burkholderiales bacterium]
MSSQNNSGLQHQKDDAVTVVATAVIAVNRIVAYDGAYATAAGGVHDAQGVSEMDGAIGDAISVVTEYSYLVECSEAIAFGAYVKPATDGTGRGAVGTLADHCGRALGATASAGQLFEMQIVKHIHA